MITITVILLLLSLVVLFYIGKNIGGSESFSSVALASSLLFGAIFVSKFCDLEQSVTKGGNMEETKIANFNIMSNFAARYAIPSGRNSLQRGPEDDANSSRRYMSILAMLDVIFMDPRNDYMRIDILALEELTNTFLEKLLSYSAQSVNIRNYDVLYDEPAEIPGRPKIYSNCILVCRHKFISKKFVDQRLMSRIENVDNFSKIQSLEVIPKRANQTPRNPLLIFNVHLNGDPSASEQRKNTIKEICLYSPAGISNKNVRKIIIGDFNAAADEFYGAEIQKILSSTGMIFYTPVKCYYFQSGVQECLNNITSYSRFTWDQMKKEFIVKSDKKAWEDLDHIIYSKNLKLQRARSFGNKQNFAEETGFEADPEFEVPYRQSGDFTVEPNFEVWPSDHTLNIYNFARF